MSNRIKILIVEDEPHASAQLQLYLSEILEAEYFFAQEVDEAVKILKSTSIDLAFLDIMIGDDLSFAIFNKTSLSEQPPIIFTTAYSKFAIQAFKLNSIDYLLKPIKKEELKRAVEKWQQTKTPNKQDFFQLYQLFNKESKSYKNRFVGELGEKIFNIIADDIVAFYAEGRYTMILCSDGKKYINEDTLDELIQKIDPSQFFRVNRKIILQYKYIDTMLKYTRSRLKVFLKIDPGFEVLVSVQNANEFKKWLEDGNS